MSSLPSTVKELEGREGKTLIPSVIGDRWCCIPKGNNFPGSTSVERLPTVAAPKQTLHLFPSSLRDVPFLLGGLGPPRTPACKWERSKHNTWHLLPPVIE